MQVVEPVEYDVIMISKILLVEDSPADTELTFTALKKCSVKSEIVVVRDGQEAIDYLLRLGNYSDRVAENPRLILLDLNLPKVDGFEVLKKVKFNPLLSSIPVVVFTDYSPPTYADRSVSLGADKHIVKPITADGFTEIIRFICEQYDLA